MKERAKKGHLRIVKRPSLEPFRSLLVPLDFSAISDRVLARVALLPLADDARVTLMHVVPKSLSPDDQHRAERDAAQSLAKEARHLASSLAKSIHIEKVVEVGSAFKKIASAAKASKADMVVMGRGGGRALRDHFVGSTAERVIRQSQLPVLVVRLAARVAYSRPAVALDLDQAAHEVVRMVVRTVRAPRPRVSVLHAFTPPYENLSYPSLPQRAVEERRKDCQLRASQELAKLLSTSLAKANVLPEHAPAWKFLVRYGSARTIIAKAAKQAETDLLVLGTQAHKGLAHVFLGTVAGDVLREVACDVLVVPPRSARS